MGILFTRTGSSIRLRSDRNTAIAALMHNKTVEASARTLPLLLSLCPIAQSRALLAASETIRAQEENDALDPSVALEAALESLRYLSIDLRGTLNAAPGNKELLGRIGQLRGKLLTAKDTLVPEGLSHAVKDLVCDFLQTEAPLFEMARTRLKALPSVELPGSILLGATELTAPGNPEAFHENLLRDANFALTPTLYGHRLVGAVAEMPQPKATWQILDVLESRLQELERFAKGLPTRLGHIRTHRLGNQGALALTQTARGPLLLVLELEADTHIRTFATIAPTEWAFQPQGVAVTLLEAMLRSSPTLSEDELQLVATVLDPCTDIQLRRNAHA